MAEKYLKKQGYKSLYKNYKTPFGEADLVMRQGEYVVFIEVKARTGDDYGNPAEAVTKAKQARYRKIASYFCSGERAEQSVRFDVVEVFDKDRIEHIEDAF